MAATKLPNNSWADKVRVSDASTRFTLENLPRQVAGKLKIPKEVLQESTSQWTCQEDKPQANKDDDSPMLGEKESMARESVNGSKGEAIDKQVHLDEPVETTINPQAINPTSNTNRSTTSKEAKSKGLVEDEDGNGQSQEAQRVNGTMLPPDPPWLLRAWGCLIGNFSLRGKILTSSESW
ncbi:hypothetical protein OIU79_029110 [Salix purpurea]|uniref:Uncharacterized protein n=1 Tax=Salix purpurea TaxID=77065 RepID=A0A9Q0VY23_SALPP|nr:hypothetical protein OIU79_029110 [Salix purpurea]